MGAVCRQLSASQFFAGVVHLALCVAEKRDPHNRALQWYNASTADDRQQQQQMAAISQNATLARKECYEQICSVLQHLYAMAASHPQSPSVIFSFSSSLVMGESTLELVGRFWFSLLFYFFTCRFRNHLGL